MNYAFFQVLQGAVIFGVTSGALGAFALLRQQSLLGDAISHAALPGIVIMFLCTCSKNPWVLLCGGALTGIIGVMCMNYIVLHTKLKKDAILGIILSVFFGFGLVLMTIAQKYSISSQAILNKFLFGNVATLLAEDVYGIAIISLFIFVILIALWKECALYVFDPIFTQVIGFNVHIIEKILTLLLVLAIVIGLQTVGVVLMSTMLIAPAAAARQWTTTLFSMVMLAGICGGIAASVGVYVSSMVNHVPTGPAIVIAASIIVLFSLFCAPRRGGI